MEPENDLEEVPDITPEEVEDVLADDEPIEPEDVPY